MTNDPAFDPAEMLSTVIKRITDSVAPLLPRPAPPPPPPPMTRTQVQDAQAATFRASSQARQRIALKAERDATLLPEERAWPWRPRTEPTNEHARRTAIDLERFLNG